MYFKIHKDGWVFIISAFIISFITFPFFQIISIFFAILGFFIIYFFRDPNRSIPIEDFIVSPADGKIVYIGESNLPDELGITGDYLKISIFLDVFNVHVNRFPFDGIVQNVDVKSGEFLAAFNHNVSEVNEQVVTTVYHKKLKYKITQIAGIFARRILCYAEPKVSVKKGDRLGFIRFGSRTDLVVSSNINICVKEGDKVKGGETVLARVQK